MAHDGYGRNLYWALPNVLALVLALAALGGGIALLFLGRPALGAAVLGLAVLGLLVLAQEALRRQAVASGYGRARALSGYAGVSLRTWSRTGGRVARLRVESARLLRERRRLQFALGGAAYAGDRKAAAELTEALRRVDEQLVACAGEAAHSVESAQRRLAEERLALAPTQIRRAD
jgi:hypothetical protein